MNYRLLTHLLLWALGCMALRASSLTFSGGEHSVVRLDADKSTGLSAIYVAYSTDGLSAAYTPDSDAAQVRWYSYGYRGGAYAEQVGSGLNFNGFNGSGGYIVEEDDKRTYLWLCDYSSAPMTAGELTVTSADCSATELSYSGSAPALTYYSATGRKLEIDRDISLTYYRLMADENSFSQHTVTRSLPYIGATISVPAPLCATRFSISGDRFLRAWGLGIDCSSVVFNPVAVEAVSSAVQAGRDVPNEQTTPAGDGAAFGGSAPVAMTFSAAVSDAAVFMEWQVADDPDFNSITLRERALCFEHTFTETATSYVRFVCANADGSCEWTGDTYTVAIGESRLRCPNAFSPGASEGVNDEWKVSYRSIVQFECHIFNSLGVKIAQLNDPAQGWDGKYKGSFVKPGVYYYVIKARGADGKAYNLSGDINIVGSRTR